MATFLYESYYGVLPIQSDVIKHYQVKGAKHGVRRWQNYDGSYTPAGRVHYGVGPPRGSAQNKAKTDVGGKKSLLKKIGNDLKEFSKDVAEGREIGRAERAEAKAARQAEKEAKKEFGEGKH